MLDGNIMNISLEKKIEGEKILDGHTRRNFSHRSFSYREILQAMSKSELNIKMESFIWLFLRKHQPAIKKVRKE